jgi:cation transport regulator ChaB
MVGGKLKKILLLALLAGSVGCAKKAVSVHPGAISNLDSYAYDVLLVEQDTINQAKAEFQGGQLPSSAKDPLNYAIKQYNVAHVAWETYHNGANQRAGDASALQQAIEVLVAAVGEVLKQMPNKNVLKPVAFGGAHVNYAYA